MAIHQVLVDASCGLVESGEEFSQMLGTFNRDGADIYQRGAVGSNLEAFEAALTLGNHCLLMVIDIYGKNLVPPAEHNSLVVEPHGIELGGGGGGQSRWFATIGRHQIELHIALVLFHADGFHAIDQLAAVGTHVIAGQLPQAPHHFGGEAAVGNRYWLFLDDILLIGILFLVTRCHAKGGSGQRK